ncbi:MAG: AAA family ATPase [Rhizobium sp.]|nr:AAA family ATPase [Rhizobium sp.]
MSITDDLLAFAKTRPAWEQDLFRRIYTQPDLVESDYVEVLAMIKAANGIELDTVANDPVPLAADHVLHRPDGADPVVLGSIHDIRNAMQLASGQTLSFAVNGLTIVYGENGSGKSGYCKLLKQICRARRERNDEVVLENAYSTDRLSKPSLTVRFKVGQAEAQDHRWETGAPPPPALSRVSVFDSRLAPLYADKQDKIEFLPAGLDVLPRVVKACTELSRRLNDEMEPLRAIVASPLPDIERDTLQAEAVGKLNENTALKSIPSEAAFQKLALWSSDDDARTELIQDDIRSDRAALGKEKTRGVGILKTLHEHLVNAENLLSADAITNLNSKIAKCIATREAAALAASLEFRDDPLSTVIGSEPWRQMFGYAITVYADAFHGAELPTHGDNEVCPLCAQKLSDGAFDRLVKFRALIANEAAKQAESALASLTPDVSALRQLTLPSADQIVSSLTPFIVEGSAEASVLNELLKWLVSADQFRSALAQLADALVDVSALGVMEPGKSSEIEIWANALAASAAADQAAATDPERLNRLRAELRDLRARKQLHDNLPAALQRRSQLITLSKLSGCIASRHSAPISSKNTELCEKYLTEDFRRKLQKEIADLGIAYLPVVVTGRTDRGVSYVGPDLSKSISAKTSNILSEGEFRALSLACFFAEIGSIDGHDGVILDDPVSSLDHKHVRQVATRILAEARHRQVIVFTHELSFYYELWHQAIEAHVDVLRHWIVKTEEHGFGTVRNDDAPWQVKSTKDRLTALDLKLTSMASQVSKDTEAYEREVTDFFTGLRETWERLVEEMLLNGVVGRFQPGVMTQSLSGVEVRDSDFTTIHFGMRKTSELSGHDWSKGRLPYTPSIEDMKREVDTVRTYFAELKKRREEVASIRRKAVSAPQKAETLA